jgi:hypothetical protein
VFATDNLGFSPEWFSRVGGELYLAGLNTTMTPLPETATEVKASGEAIEKLKQCAAEMIGAVDGKPMEVLRQSLVRLEDLDFAHCTCSFSCSVSAPYQPAADPSYAVSRTRNSGAGSRPVEGAMEESSLPLVMVLGAYRKLRVRGALWRK